MLMDHQHKKMLLISPSSTTHNWPQIDDEDDLQNKGVMGSTTTAVVGGGGAAAASSSCSTRLMMEKPGQEQLQQQQQALKCPRCDSSNTKFCYYNNYSLSQPRHFCKACKRYWTRGGTLRNVPVGGGCRKNKRVKRPTSSSSTAVDNNGASSSASSAPPPSGNNNKSNQQHIDLLTSVANSNHMNPLFYGDHHHHHLGINNQFMTSSGGRGFDQFSAVGLGFGGDHQRLINPARAKQIQDLVAASSLHASNHPIFNSSTLAYGTAPTTMASVLASKFINGGFKDVTAGNNNNQGYFQNLLPFEDLQIAAEEDGGGEGKEVKVEESRINMGWSGSNHLQAGNNTEQQIGGLSSTTDPTTLYWSLSSSNNINNNNLGANNWHDPAANLGSSVSSLI